MALAAGALSKFYLMIDMKIKIAGVCIAVDLIYPATEKYLMDYASNDAPCFSLTLTPSDIEYERAQSLRVDEKEGNPPRRFSDPYLEAIALQRKVSEALLERDILLFHGSVVSVDGVAYLFTAKSGTGKSTHTRLWRELFGERAVMVNDDKPFLSVKGERILVHGSPWNGKHRLGNNISVPLRAICILERGETNLIQRIPASEAVPMLIQQSSRPRNAAWMPKYLELLDALSRGVGFYRLSCNMELEAARVSYEGMSREL